MTTMAKRPKILIVNDDGIDAPGLKALREAVRELGDVLVCAPDSERSGAGCSLSLTDRVAVQDRRENGVVWGHAISGTPADCVKFALTALGGYEPDLVLSGVNRGRNVGNFVWYSGTVAGAIEATLFGRRAMAVSLSIFKDDKRLLFDSAARVAAALVPWLLEQPWTPRSFWNLNVPDVEHDEIRGIRMTHQGTQFFADAYVPESEDGDVRYYVNRGAGMQNSPEPDDSDDRVLDQRCASLSLLSTDLTVPVPAAARGALEARWNGLLRASGA